VKKNVSQKGDTYNRQIKVKEAFTGRNLTRFGGSGLIRRFFKRHRVKEEFEERVTIEARRKSKYTIGDMLISCLYGMWLGYPRPGHMEVLSTDKVFQKVAGLFAFPVQSTISRFLSSLRVAVSREIASFNFDLLMKFRDDFRGWKTITLDLDSHVTPVYGNQQRAGVGYNPKKKGRKSYHPLFCFVGETRDYIGGVLRNGKHHTSYHAVAFLRGLIKGLPRHIETIRVRADSGFFSRDMISFLIKKTIEFYIVVPMQPWVQRKIRHMGQWKDVGSGVETGGCDYVFTKDTTLRMVVVRQRVKTGRSPRKQLTLLNTGHLSYDYQVILTNSGREGEEVWSYYNKRACCENFIKEGIYGFGLDKGVSHTYGGNCSWFELLMLAYNLMNFFKQEVLHQGKVKQTIQTIRDRLFLIPGRLVATSRRRVLKLETTWRISRNIWRPSPGSAEHNSIKTDREDMGQGAICPTSHFSINGK
jgi:hypothetical protein